jgi:insulysin
MVGTKLIYEKPVPDPDNVNSAIEYYCQVPGAVTDLRTRACLLLLGQIGKEKSFDFLRTKLQLGYIVYSLTRGIITAGG